MHLVFRYQVLVHHHDLVGLIVAHVSGVIVFGAVTPSEGGACTIPSTIPEVFCGPVSPNPYGLFGVT